MKTLIITGGSTGIGEATVKKFSEHGYRVFNLDVNPPLESFQNTHYIPCDVANVTQLQASVKHVMTKTQTLDTAVSCAGNFSQERLKTLPKLRSMTSYTLTLKARFSFYNLCYRFLKSNAMAALC